MLDLLIVIVIKKIKINIKDLKIKLKEEGVLNIIKITILFIKIS